MFGLGITTIIISNEENNDIVKIVNSLEEFHLLIKGVSKTIVYEAEEQKWGYLAILLGTLGASLLGNMLAGKGVIIAGEGKIRAVEGTIRVDQNF